MTRKEKVELLRYIFEGHCTFSDITEHFPKITRSELSYLSSCPHEGDRLLHADPCRPLSERENFAPDDQFELTDIGMNLLDEYLHEMGLMKIDMEANDLAQKTYDASLRSERLSKIAIWIAGVSMLLSLTQFLQKLLSN